MSADGLPRWKFSEILLMGKFSSKNVLVVEGGSDRRFFETWAHRTGYSNTLVIFEIMRIQISDDRVRELGLNLGERSRVISLATDHVDDKLRLRCIADRDTGIDVDEFTPETLLWTDYPALESYALKKEVLEVFSRNTLREKISATALYDGLTPAVRAIFAFRLTKPHLSNVNYDKGFPKGHKGLADFEVNKIVEGASLGEEQLPKLKITDNPRTYGYGHDIANLILAAYKKTFKHEIGITSVRAIEDALLTAVIIEGSFESEPLFTSLKNWLGDTCDG